MKLINFDIVIDPSILIWNVDDYNLNITKYYDIQANIILLIESLEKYRPIILMRQELLNEILNNIPYTLINNSLRSRLLSFLTKINNQILTYKITKAFETKSVPEIIKNYYLESTKKEISYLLTEIHLKKILFLTFTEFWDNNYSFLKTINISENEHFTFISNKETKFLDFFEKQKPIFIHNPKHDRIKKHPSNKGFNVSKLSCYDGVNNKYVQELLESSIEFEKYYYNYDFKNKVFVIFENNIQNQFSGFDILESEVPTLPKQKLKKLYLLK